MTMLNEEKEVEESVRACTVEDVRAYRDRFDSSWRTAVRAVRDDGWRPEHQSSDGYTIAEIDGAIQAISGTHSVRLDDVSWSRPHAMLDAAARAFRDLRPEDHHTYVLRAALRDLDKHGTLNPRKEADHA